MKCDICRRGHHPTRLPFLCAVDARNKIYEARISNLQVLIENDQMRHHAAALMSDAVHSSSRGALEATCSQQVTAEDHTSQVLEAADKLRNDIKAARDEIQARKAALAHRRSDLSTLSDRLVDRRAKQRGELERSTQVLKFHWSQSAEEMASNRSFLCHEAASLYGLKRVPGREGDGVTEYEIGGVPVVNLMDMNSLSPELITASLGHITHVLALASHYLSIRLPAEITTPHRDYPYPTILSPSSSYKFTELPFPDTSGPTTPTGTIPDKITRHIPKPRPLYIQKALPQLLKDDPAAYSHFIEAVSLLAYDISWLCSSQGMAIGDRNPPDDVYQIGRNLYSLLIQPRSKRFNREASTKGNPSPPKGDQDEKLSPTWIGRYSHGTMYYPLASAEGADIIRAFKLPNPMKLAIRLKKKLVGDAPAPDWEVLDDDAWKVEDVPTDGMGKNATDAIAESGMTTRSSDAPGDSVQWTKVR